MKSILSIAYKSLIRTFHDKKFIALSLFFLIGLPSLQVILVGDGTALGHLQLYISYSLNFIIVFLSLMSIFHSCNSLNEELEKKQMLVLATKPVKRWQILVGYWLGSSIIFLGLLGFSAATNLGGIKLITSQYKNILTDAEKTNLNKTFFSAKRSVSPAIPDLKERVNEKIKQIRQEKKKTISHKEIEKKVKQDTFYEFFCAPPRYEKKWLFHDIKNVIGKTITLRFRYYCSDVPKDGKIRSRWIFGKPGAELDIFTNETHDVAHEIVIPLSAVDENGDLHVTFTNIDESFVTLIFPRKDGIEILYNSGSFIVNYLKSILLIACQIVFLCAVGTMLSSFLSFPVACLMGLFVFAVGSGSEYFIGILSQSSSSFVKELAVNETEPFSFMFFARKSIELMVHVLPHLDRINPVADITDGRFIEESTLFRGIVILCLVKGSISLIAGSLIFWKKEVARITI